MSETGGPEHEIEPVPGLPGRLPDGEYIVWQGKPETKIVMARLLRARWIAGYFGIAALWSVAVGVNNSEGAWLLMGRVTFIAVAAFFMFGMMWLYARAVSKTSLYTLTNKRLVMRVGIALSASFNLPFKQIAGADFRVGSDGAGDVALTLKSGHGLSGAVFFPHQRGGLWRKLSPQMICLTDAKLVAEKLAEHLKAYAPTSQETGVADSDSVTFETGLPACSAKPLRVAKGTQRIEMAPATG
jgi:Bacterial PH domain